jgi:hypothetical protein
LLFQSTDGCAQKQVTKKIRLTVLELGVIIYIFGHTHNN